MRLDQETSIPDSAGSDCAPEFDLLFLERYKPTVRVLYRVIGNTGRAEEIAADLFLKLYRRPLPHGCNAAAWLYGAAVRAGIDELRASARRARREELGPQPAVADGPLEQLLKVERSRRVRATLCLLKRRHAELLALHGSDLSYREIAESLRLNPSSVGTLLSRAKQAFEKEYRARFGEDDTL